MLPKKTWTKFTPLIFSLLLLPLALPLPARGQETPLNRVVLGLYDSAEDYNQRSDHNLIHSNAQMVLNHLGMRVKLHDIAKGLPSDADMADVHAVLTWFLEEDMPHAEEYCAWAEKQILSGKKYIILGNFGAFKDRDSKKKTPVVAIRRLYEALHLRYDGDWTDNPLVIEVAEKDSGMVEFERTLKDETGIYEKIESTDPANRVYLKLRRTDAAHSESAAVVTTPAGGIVLESYDAFIDYVDEKMRWRINPFRFFEEALALEDRPRFDTTTLFGKRIFYSHVDGDGFRNLFEKGSYRFCGEVIRDEILRAYSLPVSVSFITAEVDPRYLGSEKLVALARDILSLDNVEAGAHTFSHPLDWEKQLTSFQIKGYSKRLSLKDSQEAEIISESPYKNAAIVHADRGKYLQTEITDSINYINGYLTPPGKKVAIFQWSGNCRPPAEAIDLTRKAGVSNINGGDSRFDRAYASYTDVEPIVRQIDGRFQVYASNSNENLYTNLWEGPYDGFNHVTETFRRTESPAEAGLIPRRLAPINIYYHFYSGEKAVSLQALKEVYDYARDQDIIPVFTSHYAAVVEGFLAAKAARLEDGGWHFSNYGECRTVRFDRTFLFPDLEKSKGVLGFNTWEKFLYVHLAETGDALLYLSQNPPSRPYLKSSSFLISEWNAGEEISFQARAFGRAVVQIGNVLPRAAYEVIADAPGGGALLKQKFYSSELGELELRLPERGRFRVTVRKAA